MKEDKNTKKVTKKKTTASKTAPKKVSGKKTVSTKASAKKAPAKKKSVTKKVVSNKEIIKTDNVVEVKEKENAYSKDLLLRAIIIVAYTLIIIIIVIGFLEPYANNLKIESSYKPAYLVKEEIIKKDNILDLESAKSKFDALSGDYFIYVGYTKMYNNDMHILDMGIASLINKYDLNDKFYYVNIDSIVKKENKVAIVNTYLGFKDVLISKVPTIIYVNSENIVRKENIITREDNNTMTVGDFQKLLDINQFVVKK